MTTWKQVVHCSFSRRSSQIKIDFRQSEDLSCDGYDCNVLEFLTTDFSQDKSPQLSRTFAIHFIRRASSKDKFFRCSAMCPTSSWCWVETVASLQLAERTHLAAEFLYLPKWRFALSSAGDFVQSSGEVTRICCSGWLPRQKKLTSFWDRWLRNIGLFSCRFKKMPVFGVHWFERPPSAIYIELRLMAEKYWIVLLPL